MGDTELTLRLPGLDAASAGRRIQELETELRSVKHQGVRVERRRESDEAMDFGATLAIILGTPAVLTLAKALVAWARRTNTARIVISDSKGHEVVLEGIDSKNAADIVAAIAPVVSAQEGRVGNS